MSVAIPFFAGTNCEQDTKWAVERLGVKAEVIWHKEEKLPNNTEVVIIPGGFSYGDYLRSGAIARFSPIMQDIIRFANSGGVVLGICNGFQILTEAHLLPGALTRNENLHFISSFEKVKVMNNNNLFLSQCELNETLNLPVAHADGRFVYDDETLKSLYDNEQVILTYCSDNGEAKNLNGSVDNIAGICNINKNVFGLMPHPERAVDKQLGSEDGIKMLQGILSIIK